MTADRFATARARAVMARHALAWAAWTIGVFCAIWLVAESPFDADHYVTALLGGTVAWACDAALLPALRRVAAGWPLGMLVLVRTLAYAALLTVMTALVGEGSVAIGTASGENRAPDGFWPLVAALLLSSFAINLVLHVVRLVGARDLLRLLLGTYSTPARERRVFLFIDMQGSTGIAESLDSRDFAALKNDCFHDLAVAVEATRGDLFKYIGDGAIVTWRAAPEGPIEPDWMRCHFLMLDRIQRRASHYRRRYNLVPRFRSGCAAGLVTVCELGDLKRQIDYSGDAPNVAARLQGACATLGCDFVAASDLLEGTRPPAGIAARPAGHLSLRGKSRETAVLRIDLTRPAPAL